jgi:hypothetical protein
MGLFDKGKDKSLTRQKQSVLEEAAEAGSTVVQVIEHADENQASVAGGVLKAFVGGSLRTDAFQAFCLQTGDMAHLYVQPYSGMNPLPGEHHALLDGTLPRTLILKKGIFGGKWEAGGDKAYAKEFGKQADIKKVTSDTKWEWAVGTGKVELDWTVQTSTLPGGKTHLVLKAGRYGGFTTYKVGMKHFLWLCSAMRAKLQAQPDAPAQSFVYAPAWGELFASLLTEEEPHAEAASPAPPGVEVPPAPAHEARRPADFETLIRSVLGPREGKKIHVQTLPQKKEKNVRKHVLPESEQGAAIVAVVDITMVMGSAKDAIVFTPTHCYAKEVDDRVQFPLADLESVHGYSGKLEDGIDLEIARLGRIKVPCGGQGEAAMELFNRIAAGA